MDVWEGELGAIKNDTRRKDKNTRKKQKKFFKGERVFKENWNQFDIGDLSEVNFNLCITSRWWTGQAGILGFFFKIF